MDVSDTGDEDAADEPNEVIADAMHGLAESPCDIESSRQALEQFKFVQPAERRPTEDRDPTRGRQRSGSKKRRRASDDSPDGSTTTHTGRRIKQIE